MENGIEISGSLGPNASLIRSLTAAGISGSWQSQFFNTLTAAGISGSTNFKIKGNNLPNEINVNGLDTNENVKLLDNLNFLKISNLFFLNNVKVNVRANNCEDSEVEQELAREKNVEGYPTIKLVKNNEVVDYNGPRTKEGLMEFINEETKN